MERDKKLKAEVVIAVLEELAALIERTGTVSIPKAVADALNSANAGAGVISQLNPQELLLRVRELKAE